MIKQLIVAASAALLCAGAQAASYKDGTYTGEGTGNASKIQVEVVVAGGKLTSVKVVKHGETEMSNSSKGSIEAVNKALESAK